MRITLAQVVFAVLCAVLALLSDDAPPFAEAVCSTARIRKNYDSMNVTERLLYRRALQLSMDKGYYIKFIEMHTEKMSEMEAHRVCMFTYWHRYFLLGFENMLRSLGPEFECITVPYWDQMLQNARFMTQSCTSLENCAMIVRDLGGSTYGNPRYSDGLDINGARVVGDRCVNAAPLNRFCQLSSKTGAACAQCVPRNNLLLKQFPPSSSFAAVYRQLFTSGPLTATSKSIEEGIHNSIHAEMGGAMGTFQSPSDPLFWSHHAYVDLLLTVYLKCRVGLGKLSDVQKQNNAYAFVQCPHREDSGFFTSTSTVTMRNGENGTNPKQVSMPGQDLYQFFASVPNKYYQLTDVTTIERNPYTYNVSGLVAQMAVQCDAAKGTTRRMLREQQRLNRNEPRHVECKADDAAPNGSIQENKPTDAPPHLALSNHDDNDPAAVKVNAWVDEVRQGLRRIPDQLDEAETAQQLEKMVCMFYDQCRGGVQDFSDEFKKAFNINEPAPCKRIVDELKAESTSLRQRIHLPNWKQLMEKYFPCSMPELSAIPQAYASDLPSEL